MCQWPAVKAVPGARRCLASLSRRVMCHVATNAADSNESDIRKALERADLDRYLTHIFCYRAIGHKKPGQAYFDTVIDRLGCQPGDVVSHRGFIGTGCPGRHAIRLGRYLVQPQRRKSANGNQVDKQAARPAPYY